MLNSDNSGSGNDEDVVSASLITGKHCMILASAANRFLGYAYRRQQRSFRGERVATSFPLLKSCRNALERRSQCSTFQERIMNHFPAKMHYIAGICIIQCTNSHFSRDDIPTPAQLPRCLVPDTNFRFARQRSHCSCFTKRPLRFIGIIVDVAADSSRPLR